MKTIKLIVLISLITALGSAQSYVFSTDVRSEFMGANGAIFHNQPVLNSSLILSLPNGIYVGTWHSVGLDNTDLSSDFGDELDLFLGFSNSYEKINLDAGIIYIDVHNLAKIPEGDVVYPYMELNMPMANLTPFVKVECSFPIVGIEPIKGTLSFIGTRHVWKLNKTIHVNQEIKTMYDSGAFGFDSGWIGQYSISLNIKSFNIHARGAYPLTELSQRDPKMIVGGGYSFKF